MSNDQVESIEKRECLELASNKNGTLERKVNAYFGLFHQNITTFSGPIRHLVRPWDIINTDVCC